MTTPSKVVSSRTRKTKNKPIVKNVVANIVFIDPEYRKERARHEWLAVFKAYVSSLNDYEVNLVMKCLSFVGANPVNRENSQELYPVISFPVGGTKRNGK